MVSAPSNVVLHFVRRGIVDIEPSRYVSPKKIHKMKSTTPDIQFNTVFSKSVYHNFSTCVSVSWSLSCGCQIRQGLCDSLVGYFLPPASGTFIKHRGTVDFFVELPRNIPVDGGVLLCCQLLRTPVWSQSRLDNLINAPLVFLSHGEPGWRAVCRAPDGGGLWSARSRLANFHSSGQIRSRRARLGVTVVAAVPVWRIVCGSINGLDMCTERKRGRCRAPVESWERRWGKRHGPWATVI